MSSGPGQQAHQGRSTMRSWPRSPFSPGRGRPPHGRAARLGGCGSASRHRPPQELGTRMLTSPPCTPNLNGGYRNPVSPLGDGAGPVPGPVLGRRISQQPIHSRPQPTAHLTPRGARGWIWSTRSETVGAREPRPPRRNPARGPDAGVRDATGSGAGQTQGGVVPDPWARPSRYWDGDVWRPTPSRRPSGRDGGASSTAPLRPPRPLPHTCPRPATAGVGCARARPPRPSAAVGAGPGFGRGGRR